MKLKLTEFTHQCFNFLFDKYGFSIKKENEDEHGFFVLYSPKSFEIEIEGDRNQVSIIVYKRNEEKEGMNVFNLLEYLIPSTVKKTSSKLLHKRN